MRRVFDIGVLSFGAVIINTMPVWVGSISRSSGIGDGLAGLFASLMLLSAAATCAGFLASQLSRLSGFILCAALGAFAFAHWINPVLVALLCMGLGGAMGNLTHHALRMVATSPKRLASISLAISLGLAASLLFYLFLPLFDLSPFVILLALALPFLFFRSHGDAAKGRPIFRLRDIRVPPQFIAFFMMMGAYWTFLELYGARFGDGDAVALWLLASLMSGACGSVLAARLPIPWQGPALTLGMALAAVTGAVSYLAQDLFVFGLSILANAFFLFLFFPLYLRSARERMPQAMAGYLLGFSVGGIAGAGLEALGGYQTLAAAVFLSGVIGLTPGSRRSFSQ